MNRHRPGPETTCARLPDNGKLARSKILHDARDRADVTGAARPDENDADVIQRALAFPEWTEFVPQDDFPVSPVELGVWIEIDCHNRAPVVDMLGTEEMSEFMDQRQNIPVTVRRPWLPDAQRFDR